ncbi:MAG: RdgB/HAM1 family non-canonical purine NTP pyrophosphatase [Clostridiales Family XIII bacterium]|jgi:XTP/dITP diphosphohydrolase|nr:RdgB/HAM1 family non-canonical purine NTP pyrophosphatase [Clostridiales Family XIII bacterium]
MRVVAATGNSHKITELRSLFGSFGVEVVSKREAGVTAPDPEETGVTFEENAIAKAQAVFACCGEATVADDSGLEVDALGGDPGIYSARFFEMSARGMPGGIFGAESDDEVNDEMPALFKQDGGVDAANNRLLLRCLKDVPPESRTARFVCAIAFIESGKEPLAIRGVCEGRIADRPSGTEGFGYDPLFIPDEYASEGLTFAQLTEADKNRISHRGRALALLAEKLRAR